MGHIQLQRKWC